MWYRYSLIALLGLGMTSTASAQQPYYPPSQYYPPNSNGYPYGRPYAPPAYNPSPGGYGQQPAPYGQQQPTQQDPRQAWSYSAGTGGTFQHTYGNQWAEYRNGQSPISYVEVARTAQYVEIYDQNRNLGVRLYPDQLWQTTPEGTWQPMYEGHWS